MGTLPLKKKALIVRMVSFFLWRISDTEQANFLQLPYQEIINPVEAQFKCNQDD